MKHIHFVRSENIHQLFQIVRGSEVTGNVYHLPAVQKVGIIFHGHGVQPVRRFFIFQHRQQSLRTVENSVRRGGADFYPIAAYNHIIVFIVHSFRLVGQSFQSNCDGSLVNYLQTIQGGQFLFQQPRLAGILVRINQSHLTVQHNTTLGRRYFLYRRQYIRLLQSRRMRQTEVRFVYLNRIRIAGQ